MSSQPAPSLEMPSLSAAEPRLPWALPGLRALTRSRAADVGGRRLRVWVAGCATGAGPSELMIVARALSELPDGGVIFGTDRDPIALQELDVPRFPSVDIWLRLSDPVGVSDRRDHDLVLCRGVVATLEAEYRDAVVETLRRSVLPGGALVLG